MIHISPNVHYQFMRLLNAPSVSRPNVARDRQGERQGGNGREWASEETALPASSQALHLKFNFESFSNFTHLEEIQCRDNWLIIHCWPPSKCWAEHWLEWLPFGVMQQCGQVHVQLFTLHTHRNNKNRVIATVPLADLLATTLHRLVAQTNWLTCSGIFAQ